MADKIDALTQQIHTIGVGKGKGPVMKNDGGWHPQPTAADIASHPICPVCKGKHKKLGPKKCPTCTQDGDGKIQKPYHARDLCTYADPDDGVICGGAGHTVGHHIRVAKMLGVNKAKGGVTGGKFGGKLGAKGVGKGGKKGAKKGAKTGKKKGAKTGKG